MQCPSPHFFHSHLIANYCSLVCSLNNSHWPSCWLVAMSRQAMVAHWLAAWCAAVSLVWCHAVWPAAAQATAGQALGNSRQVEVSTAPGLTRALRDPNVWDITITADIDMAEDLASWAALPADIFLEHNLTITGPPGQWPAINFRQWQVNGTKNLAKGFILAPNVSITFQYLTIMQTTQVVPAMVIGGDSTSWANMLNCILFRYVGIEINLALSGFFNLPSPPWEPPNYRKGFIAPAGYCRVAPAPQMCWDSVYVIWAYMSDFTNVLVPQNRSTTIRSRLEDFVSVREEVASDACFQNFLKGNDSCMYELVGTVMARAAPGSMWPQRPAPPERVNTVMAAYAGTLAQELSGNGSSAAQASAPSPDNTSKDNKFNKAGIAAIVGAVVLVACAGAVWWAYTRKRMCWRDPEAGNPGDKPSTSQEAPDAGHVEVQMAGAASAVAGGGGGEGSNKGRLESLPEAASSYSHVDSHDMSSELQRTGVGSSVSTRKMPSGGTWSALPGMSVTNASSSAWSTNSGWSDTGSKSTKSGSFQLQELVTPKTPFIPSLSQDLKLGVNVHLDEKIGEGAMGCVYRATYQGQAVAVKMFNAGADVRSFVSELGILARTQHPNVVQLIGKCVNGEQLALVEELADGSLEQLLYADTRRADPTAPDQPTTSATPQSVLLPLPLIFHIAMEVATGLAYLHPTIIHRDLKPGNVLFKQAGGSSSSSGIPSRDQIMNDWQDLRVLLSDFGISRIFNAMTFMTEHSHHGTVPYMAPECFVHNTRLTHKCDIYSFGILLWELLHGVRVWQGYNPSQVIYEVVVAGRRPAFTVPEDRCAAALRSLIERCWQGDADTRPPALEIVRELSVIQRQLGLVVDAPAVPEQQPQGMR